MHPELRRLIAYIGGGLAAAAVCEFLLWRDGRHRAGKIPTGVCVTDIYFGDTIDTTAELLRSEEELSWGYDSPIRTAQEYDQMRFRRRYGADNPEAN